MQELVPQAIARLNVVPECHSQKLPALPALLMLLPAMSGCSIVPAAAAAQHIYCWCSIEAAAVLSLYMYLHSLLQQLASLVLLCPAASATLAARVPVHRHWQHSLRHSL